MAGGQQTAALAGIGLAAFGVPPAGVAGAPGGLGFSFADVGPTGGNIGASTSTFGNNWTSGRGTASNGPIAPLVPAPAAPVYGPWAVSPTEAAAAAYGPTMPAFPTMPDPFGGDFTQPLQAGGWTTYALVGVLLLVALRKRNGGT